MCGLTPSPLVFCHLTPPPLCRSLLTTFKKLECDEKRTRKVENSRIDYVCAGFLAFLRLGFPRNFLHFRLKSLRFVRNSCAAEIHAFQRKFLRFTQNSCVLGEIIAPFKILAFQLKFLRFTQNSCVLGEMFVPFKILSFQ